MKCRERLAELGVRVLETHPGGVEFVCRPDEGVFTQDMYEALEGLDFWDYCELSLWKLREPWWTGTYDPNDEFILVVMGDPDQEA